MMGGMIALLLLSIVPYQDPNFITRTTDVVEHNFFYDDNGRLVFEQDIWWDWDPIATRHQVRAWRLVKVPSQVPARQPDGLWLTTWEENGKTYRIYSRGFNRSDEQYDKELIEREYLPKEKRKGFD